MATYGFVEIDLPEAAALADLTGVQFDLQTAQGFARLAIEAHSRRGPNHGTLTDALMTATLVRYARSFVGGARERLKGDALKCLTPVQQDKHKWLLSIRDKYCAHSVNAFEESQLVARYWEERVQDQGFGSVDCIHTRVIGLSPADLEALVAIAGEFLKHVEVRMNAEKRIVLEVVRQRPVAEVLNRPQKGPSSKLPDPGKGRPSRKRQPKV